MKIIGILIILFGLYYCNFGQTNTSPNNRFNFKPIAPQLNIDNPYIQFHKYNRGTPSIENNLDWKFKGGNALTRNYLCEIRSLKKSENAISFASSMPVYNPGLLRNMPVLNPDSSMHFHMLIKKINQLTLPEIALR
jgi:hypothetical protein